MKICAVLKQKAADFAGQKLGQGSLQVRVQWTAGLLIGQCKNQRTSVTTDVSCIMSVCKHGKLPSDHRQKMREGHLKVHDAH